MKKSCLILFIAITVLCVSGFGQSRSFSDLTLDLAPHKPTVLQMEPIPFRIALVNNTDAPVPGVAVSIYFNSRAVKLEIRQPNGKVVVPEGLSGLHARIFPELFPRELEPGGKIEATQVFDTGHYLFFGKAGEYQVRASVTNGDRRVVQSDWMNLTVAKPVGLEKDAYNYLLTNMKKRPDNYVPFNKWSIDEMEEFVLQYPGTVYSDYVRYALVGWYFDRDKVRTESHLRQINEKDFVYARDVSSKLKKLEEQKKNQD
jgi:hypothetical protein